MTDEPWEDATDDSGQFAVERDGPAWERDGAGAGSFLATVKGVLLAPTQTFQTMRRDGGLGTPFLFGLLGGTIGVWASVVYQAVLLMISGEIGAIGVLMGTAIGGPIAIIGGPRGGSHLDQFMAMFADNNLAFTIGMPTGGYSNTWEASEVLTFPGTDQPVVEFMWNIGHTLRPNGEILEGNPVMPEVYVPLTRENFRTYHRDLLTAALDRLARSVS